MKGCFDVVGTGRASLCTLCSVLCRARSRRFCRWVLRPTWVDKGCFHTAALVGATAGCVVVAQGKKQEALKVGAQVDGLL